MISDDAQPVYPYASRKANLAIAVNKSNGIFVITWTDSREGPYDIYAQCYNPNGKPDSINCRVNNGSRKSRQQNPALATYCGNIYFTWEDDRIRGQGWDIFAKVVEKDTICDVEDKEILNTSVPECFYLS